MENIDPVYYARGFTNLCGVDEAGRGPLAGPVVAAAVVLNPARPIPGLDDSKKLSAQQREYLYSHILSAAIAVGRGQASTAEIDDLNILQATFLAMRRAVDDLVIWPDYVLVDGRDFPGFSRHDQNKAPGEALIKGDSRSACIAAASIVAKVTRDRLMCGLAEQYPGYGFEQHKGYATAGHFAALEQFGPCVEHRPLFLRKWTAGRK